MTDHRQRLSALRSELALERLDGFILSTGDEHLTEFPAPYSQRLRWLTGFTGSTASAAVLADKAAIFVDGRYTDSVRAQVDVCYWSFEDVPQTSVGAWLANHATGARIGYDPELYSHRTLSAIAHMLTGKAELVPISENPIDRLWTNQPLRPESQVFIQPLELAGKASVNKRQEVAEWLGSVKADACVLTALDSIAWLFNIRAADVDIAPLAYSYAICHRDGSADLFLDPHRINDAVRRHLGNSVRLLPYGAFYKALGELGGQNVSVDPDLTPVAAYTALQQAGSTTREDRDPTQLPKAIKNAVEIEAMKQAHIRDGAALTRFLHWFSIEAPKGHLTELSAAAKLNDLRRETEGFHSLSFEPISAVDANAAIPHYWPTLNTDTPIRHDSIYLIDSGGQYPNGTTDVTRTVAVGLVRPEIKDRFTRVLKGYIALETTVFPHGTTGSRLDAVARLPLWEGGVDCSHAIGHGVGQFLNVHEGPAFISPNFRPSETALEAGMILSNEPGYYKTGEYGIRTENLMLVVERSVEGGDRPMLAFEPITMAPIDRNLIDLSILTDAEVGWLDQYHERVLENIGPLLTPEQRAWLEHQTASVRDFPMPRVVPDYPASNAHPTGQ